MPQVECKEYILDRDLYLTQSIFLKNKLSNNNVCSILEYRHKNDFPNYYRKIIIQNNIYENYAIGKNLLVFYQGEIGKDKIVLTAGIEKEIQFILDKVGDEGNLIVKRIIFNGFDITDIITKIFFAMPNIASRWSEIAEGKNYYEISMEDLNEVCEDSQTNDVIGYFLDGIMQEEDFTYISDVFKIFDNFDYSRISNGLAFYKKEYVVLTSSNMLAIFSIYNDKIWFIKTLDKYLYKCEDGIATYKTKITFSNHSVKDVIPINILDFVSYYNFMGDCEFVIQTVPYCSIFGTYFFGVPIYLYTNMVKSPGEAPMGYLKLYYMGEAKYQCKAEVGIGENSNIFSYIIPIHTKLFDKDFYEWLK